jgi:endonuclease YncB( thermonuclease family)
MAVIRPPQFDRKWQRQRRWQARWRTGRVWLAVAAIVALGVWLSGVPGSLRHATLTEARFVLCGSRPGPACVIDGDTLAFGERRIRLAGFDAPELDGPCEAERLKAREARGALLAWLNRGPFYVDGGDDPPRDKYRRELRTAWRVTDGREEWLSEEMIAQGLAESSSWSAAKVDWCFEK